MRASPPILAISGAINTVQSSLFWCYSGTTNFVHSYPNVCVSIALVVKKEVVVGVVYNPIVDELFTAAKVGSVTNDVAAKVADCLGRGLQSCFGPAHHSYEGGAHY